MDIDKWPAENSGDACRSLHSGLRPQGERARPPCPGGEWMPEAPDPTELDDGTEPGDETGDETGEDVATSVWCAAGSERAAPVALGSDLDTGVAD